MSMPQRPILEFRGPTRWLSNFHPAKVMLDGVTYPTTEHAYQAAKTTDPEIRKQVLKFSRPGEAKQWGACLTPRPDWREVNLGIMLDLNLQKFRNNRELGISLLETGDGHLEEGNTWGDEFWGTVNGKGRNELGKILMQVREILRKECVHDGPWIETNPPFCALCGFTNEAERR